MTGRTLATRFALGVVFFVVMMSVMVPLLLAGIVLAFVATNELLGVTGTQLREAAGWGWLGLFLALTVATSWLATVVACFVLSMAAGLIGNRWFLQEMATRPQREGPLYRTIAWVHPLAMRLTGVAANPKE
jgi:hypothetical protein